MPGAADSLGFYRVWNFPDSSGVDTLDGQTIPDKALIEFPPQSVLVVESAGGGGFGPRDQRDIDFITHDLLEGYVTS